VLLEHDLDEASEQSSQNDDASSIGRPGPDGDHQDWPRHEEALGEWQDNPEDHIPDGPGCGSIP
jgi:hypothetical protein